MWDVTQVHRFMCCLARAEWVLWWDFVLHFENSGSSQVSRSGMWDGPVGVIGVLCRVVT